MCSFSFYVLTRKVSLFTLSLKFVLWHVSSHNRKSFCGKRSKKTFYPFATLNDFFNVSKRIVEKFRESPFFVHRSHSNMGKNFLVQELLTLFLCDSKEINWQHLSPTVVVYFIRKPIPNPTTPTPSVDWKAIKKCV